MAEIYTIADCLLIHGDCFDPSVSEIVLKRFGSKAFSVVTADPPYGKIVKRPWDLADEHEVLGIYERTMAQVLKNFLAPGGVAAFWWGIGKPGCRPGYRFVSTAEYTFDVEQIEHVTWRKRRAYGTATNLLFVREELSLFRRQGEVHTFNVPLLDKDRGYAGFNKKYPARSPKLRRTNVWDDITEIFKGKIHECQKPDRLYEVIYSTWRSSGPVLDLFAGSGAAAVAAHRLGIPSCVVEAGDEEFEVMHRYLKEQLT